MDQTTTGTMPTPARRRVDGRTKVTGAADYTGDVVPGGCLHAALVSSAITRGRILGIDTGEAEAAPGVRLVLTHLNAPRPNPAPVLLGREDKKASAGTARLPLQDDRVAHAGEHVALVAAETVAEAEHAASLVRVRYAAEASAVDVEDEAASPALDEPVDSWEDPAVAARGDFARGWGEGSVRVGETYATALQHHVTMEPHATVASWEDGQVPAHGSATWVHGMRRTLAAWFGLAARGLP